MSQAPQAARRTIRQRGGRYVRIKCSPALSPGLPQTPDVFLTQLPLQLPVRTASRTISLVVAYSPDSTAVLSAKTCSLVGATLSFSTDATEIAPQTGHKLPVYAALAYTKRP